MTPEVDLVDADVAAPRPAATVMVLRDGEKGRLEVLLLRRSTGTPFVPGVHVFPGGAVEDADHHPHPRVARGLDDSTANAVLGVHGGALGSWVAAARECLEEAGILLARTADGAHVAPDHPLLRDLDAARTAVEAGERSLVELLDEHDLHLALGSIAYVSHWITPPVSPRRYDTRFFAAEMPPGQHTSADGWEAVDAIWRAPADALGDWQAGHIDLIEPTFASLRLLARFDRAGEALRALSSAARRGHRVSEAEGGVRVALDGETPGSIAPIGSGPRR